MNKQKIMELVKDALGDVTLDFQTVQKNNAALHGVVIKNTTENIAPTIYYNPDESAEIIADKIITAYKSLPNFSIDPRQIMERDFILRNVRPQIVATKNNADYLADKFYNEFYDLAVLYRVWINSESSFVIHPDHLVMAGIETEEIHSAALENLKKDVDILPMGVMLGLPDDADCPFYIATNHNRSYGAAVILLPEVLKALAKRLHGDFWIIPSSIHEILAISAETCDDPVRLSGMICTVNAQEVDAQDQLADHPYFYNNERGMIEL